MSWQVHFSPIQLFNFYLALVFVLTTLLNIRDYRHMLGVARSLPNRWPRLFALVRQHAYIFLTWRTVTPAAISLALLLLQLFVTRVVAPSATAWLTFERLREHWAAIPVLIATSAAMVAFDVYANWPAAPFDRPEVEKYFDQAEYWLTSWTAPVVRVLSFGYINPRHMVAVEVRSALLNASDLLNRTLWWTAGQAGFRIVCGLSLWLTYALLHQR
jgi:hypothetical protein